MSGAIQTFSQIASLGALRHCLSTSLADGERGILSLDLDQTHRETANKIKLQVQFNLL